MAQRLSALAYGRSGISQYFDTLAGEHFDEQD